MELIHISYAGPEVLILDRKGRKWRFEDHRFCGPIVLDKHGDPLDTQPPQSSPFWEAVNCWYQQGKRTGFVHEETGKAPNWNNIWQRFMARALEKGPLKERFTEHDLRAKVGSDAESLERAAQLLAHSDPRMTQRVYRRKPERIKPAG